MDELRAYVASSIGDIQGTIRAVDIKIASFLVILLAPFSLLGRIFANIDVLIAKGPTWIFVALACAFVVLWGMSLIALVRALAPLDNPSNHVVNAAKDYKGSYYRGGMFSFGILDAFLNRKFNMADRDVRTALKDLPTSQSQILDELTFEQMKLCYIRDLKIARLGWGVRFGSWWLCLGVLIFLLARYPKLLG